VPLCPPQTPQPYPVKRVETCSVITTYANKNKC
jgi:hypothetical protein